MMPSRFTTDDAQALHDAAVAEGLPVNVDGRPASAGLNVDGRPADAGLNVDGRPADAGLNDAASFTAAAHKAIELARYDDAVSLAKAALALNPRHAPAWVVLGDVAWQQHDASAAKDAWQEAVSLDDKDLSTAIACARAQHVCGDDNAASALLSFVLMRVRSEDLRKAALALREEIDG